MKLTLYLGFVFNLCGLFAQQIDQELLLIRYRLDSIQAYSAKVLLEEDISFIDMPAKQATIHFEKGKRLEVVSDDFILVPKRGLDLSLSELFEYPFITVLRQPEELGGELYRVVNVIPTDKKAGFSIATLYLDDRLHRVVAFDITTKEEGTFKVGLSYKAPGDVLPSMAELRFNMKRLSIPVNFMGNDSNIDRKELQEEGPKEGRILLTISPYDIQKKGS